MKCLKVLNKSIFMILKGIALGVTIYRPLGVTKSIYFDIVYNKKINANIQMDQIN